MSHIFYKLTLSEAKSLCKKVGVTLPVKRWSTDRPGVYGTDLRDLNKSGTIWVQPCHFYHGDNNQFSHEIAYSSPENTMIRFMNKYKIPLRMYPY
jgi:hypothetical protein